MRKGFFFCNQFIQRQLKRRVKPEQYRSLRNKINCERLNHLPLLAIILIYFDLIPFIIQGLHALGLSKDNSFLYSSLSLSQLGISDGHGFESSKKSLII